MSANWIDITEKVNIAVNAVRVSSGPVDLSEYAVPGKPLFIAYKFLSVTDPARAAGVWIINTFTASTLLPDGSALPVANNATAEYSIFNFQNETAWYTRFYENETQALIIGGGPGGPVNDDWLITKPLFFTQVPPDAGFPIQNIGTDKLEEHIFVYDTPGTYKVTFVASNYTADEFEEVKKEFEITITE